MVEPQDEEEYVLSIDEKYLQLQKEGKCGEVQDNGRYCQSPQNEFLDLDPDRPFPQGPRIGACRTHIKMVGPRVTQMQRDFAAKRIRDYSVEQTRSLCRALRLLGFKVELNDRRYEVGVMTFANPAEFLNTLDKIGALEPLGLNLSEVRQCPAVLEQPHRWDPQRSTTYRCMEADGHHPGTRHNDWKGMDWVDPEPELVKEPIALPAAPVLEDQGTGGQFS